MNSKLVVEIYALIKKGTITPIYNERDMLVGLNYNSGSTGLQCAKNIDGHMCVGATPEELENDIKAYQEFKEKVQGLNVQHIMELALILNKDEINEQDQEVLTRALENNVRVETREVVRNVGNSQYPNLEQDLTGLDDDTLKDLMNKARRENKRDLFNAVRRERRHRGVNC